MSRVCRLVTALKPKGGETEGDVFSDNEQAPEHSGDVMPLAFPSPALWAGDTEEGYSQSPVELSANNNGIAIDPAILNDEAGQEVAYTEPEYPSHHEHHLFEPSDNLHDPSTMHYEHYEITQDQYPRDFPQGPPPEPELLLQQDQLEQLPPPSPKPHKKHKRVKRLKRENECGFCQGSDERNKEGVPETMLSCSNCGRSGHPSCLDIAHIAENVFSYPWTCIECKPCEICKDKGDDTKLLFCDNCDRGWHYDCLDPPLDGLPEGNWNCPICPPLPDEPEYLEEDEEVEESGIEEAEVSFEQAASPSATTATPRRPPKKGKGKARPRNRSSTHRTPASSKKARPTHRPPARSAPAASTPRTAGEPRVTFRLRLGRNKNAEEESPKKSPFESFLSPEEYDTSKAVIISDDKNRYEKSRIAAENKTLSRIIQSTIPPETPGASSSTALPPSASIRPLRSFAHLLPIPSTPLTPLEAPGTPGTPGGAGSFSFSTPGPTTNGEPAPLRIRTLRFGQWDIDTWYDAPFPEEYNNLPEGRLWMCEFCLRYMRSGFGWERHQTKCKTRHPPGDEIYRDDTISVFEVDGRRNKIYCQNLCLLSKMFLDHKSLFYDVEPFLFYVMTEVDDGGARFVGYFSKEKRSPKDFNVSCIMTLPVRQRKGWGNLLIDFSYLLSKKEQRVGSPERPLSALGALSYRNYWTLALMKYLRTAPDDITFEDISKATSMTIEDIVVTLREQGMLSTDERGSVSYPGSPGGVKGKGKMTKNPKRRASALFGRRSSSTRKLQLKDDPSMNSSIPTSYRIHWDRHVVEAYLAKWYGKGYLTLKPHRLKWSPYLLSRAAGVLKTDTAPSLPIGLDDIFPDSAYSPGSTFRAQSLTSTGGVSAVDQVATTGHADAGPSRSHAASVSSKAPPSVHDGEVDGDGDVEMDHDPTFHMEEESEDEEYDDGLQETPLRRGSRTSQSTRSLSLRQIPARTNSLTSTGSGAERRRTRASGRDDSAEHQAPLMNGHKSPSKENGNGQILRSSPRGRGSGTPSSNAPPRKRLRIISSPESSALSEPPSSTYTRTASPHSDHDDQDSNDDEDNDVPSNRRKARLPNGHAGKNENHDTPKLRTTRSRSSVLDPPPTSRRRPPNRRSSLRIDSSQDPGPPSPSRSRERDRDRNGRNRGQVATPFKPLFDDPESALRSARRARVSQALIEQQQQQAATAAAADNVVVPLYPKTNGAVNGSNVNVDSPSPHSGMMNDDDLLDVDAEGEEEVEDVVGYPIEASDLGEMDAEGEIDDGEADAEGEIDDELY